MAGFGIGQLVQVNNPHNLAYGRIAMVLCGKKGGRSQVRFADLPKGVAASPDPTGFVNVFDDDELIAIKDVPIAPFYGLIEMNVVDGGRESCEYLLAHSDSAAAIETIFQNVVRTWYDDDAQWNDEMEGYWIEGGLLVSATGLKLISLARYIALRDILSDCTPT